MPITKFVLECLQGAHYTPGRTVSQFRWICCICSMNADNGHTTEAAGKCGISLPTILEDGIN